MRIEDTSTSLRGVLHQTADALSKGETTTLRQLVIIAGEQGMLLLAALLTIPFLIPVSIPGVSTIFGLAIILIAISVTINRAPWLPRRILDRQIDAKKLLPTLHRGEKLVARIEGLVRPRWLAITEGQLANRIHGLAIVAGGVLLMLPLSLVPFSNTLPALAILCLCVGIVQRDGAAVIAGYVLNIASAVYFLAIFYSLFLAGRSLAEGFA